MIRGIIYKYTSPSGKCYIGQTINESNRRSVFFNMNKEYAGPKINMARAVLQYSLTGNFIQEWESAKQAGEALDIIPGAITNVCKGNRKVAGDFLWRYRSDYDTIPNRLTNINLKSASVPLKQYTLDGKFVKEWESITAAAKELGYSLGNFSTYCNGRNNHEYKGFLYYRGDISLHTC